MRRANILKPQNAFEVKPDNADNSPWKPLLTKKPHAVVPLDQSIGTFKNENGTIQYVFPTPFLQILRVASAAHFHLEGDKEASGIPIGEKEDV